MHKRFTSEALIELLCFLNGQIGDETLAALLVTNGPTYTRLKYGLYTKKDPTAGYWPNEGIWLRNAHEKLEEIAALSTSVFTDLGLDPYTDFFFPDEDFSREGAKPLTTLKDRVRDILLRFARDYQKHNGLDLRGIRTAIADFLETQNIEDDVTARIRQLETLPEICRFLAGVAGDRGRVPGQKDPIRFFSFPELRKMLGFSAGEAAQQFLKICGGAKGDVDLWAAHMSRFGSNWGFILNERDCIVGGFAMALLTQEQERLYRIGSLADKKITAESVSSGEDNDVAIDLLCLRTLPEYTFSEKLLWERFADRLLELARDGIYFRGIYATLTDEAQKTLFLKRGFQNLCPQEAGGDVFLLDLMYDIPRAFLGVFPGLYEAYSARFDAAITCGPCPPRGKLTGAQARQIAGLLYSSDRYILSSVFSSYAQAKALLSNLLTVGNDKIFRPENIFCAYCGDRIVGVILFAKGSLDWSVKTLREEAVYLGIELKQTAGLLETDYFPSYGAVRDLTVTILDDSVDTLWRSADCSISKAMLNAFIAEYGKAHDLQVHILRETQDALNIYRSAGFVSDGETHTGFASDGRELPCFYMKREKTAP